MNRREFLAVSAVSAGAVSGCQRFGSGDAMDTGRGMWRYPGTFELAGVGNGRVIGAGETVTALDAKSGDVDWRFGEGSQDWYTTPVVDDAIYFGIYDDAGGSGYGKLHALAFDGEEQWSVDTGSVYDPPFVRGDVVYVGGDDGYAWAIDTADGAIIWETELSPDGSPTRVSVIGVDDEVYATTGRLIALDRSDGSVRWQYGDEPDHISQIAKTDDMVLMTFWDDFVALDEGEEVWRAGLDAGTRRIHGIVGDHVFVDQANTLYALDTETGEERWRVDEFETLALTERTAYVGTEGVQALSVDTGERRWETSLDSTVRSISARSTAFDSSRDVPRQDETITVNTDSRLVTLDSEGVEQWSRTFDEEVYDHLYDGLLLCQTSDAIYAFL